MSKTKDWMMTMDNLIADAFDKGATDFNDVIAYLKVHLSVVDEDYVRKTVDEMLVPHWSDEIEFIIADYDRNRITEKEAIELLNALGLDGDMARGFLAK
jgi:hypothetical protein